MTPETVYPFAAQVSEARGNAHGLSWFALSDVLRSIDLLRDGKLRLVLLRASHALGLLDRIPSAAADV